MLGRTCGPMKRLISLDKALRAATTRCENISAFLITWPWIERNSIIFAIFTLALIPIVAENCQKETTSIYDVAAPFKPIWLWGETVEAKLKWACWPQHVFFLAGIILFSVGSFFGALRAKPAEEKREVWIALPAPSAPHQVAQLPLSWWRLLRTND